MIRRIVLENYMAHVRTVIEPAAGLTVLIGPNNCGKSAIIHALEMICYNSDAADFAIRHGAKKATVTVETEDENGGKHTLVWWRSRGTAGYSVDGREISGLGRNIPDDLHDHLRMPKIEPSAGGAPFLLHFGFQKSPIFLLDDPASRAAHFFASSSDADKLVEMQKRHTQKAANAKRDKEKLDVKIGDLDRQLAILAPLPDISRQLNELEEAHLKLVALEEALELIEQFIGEFSRAVEREQASRTRLQTLAALQRPPVLAEPGPLSDWVRSMALNRSAADRNEAVDSVLAPLRVPPDLNGTAALSLLCRQLAEAGVWHQCAQRRAEVLEPLRAPPARHETARLRWLIGEMERSQFRQRCAAAYSNVLQGLAEPPGLCEMAGLTVALASIEKARQLESDSRAALRLAEERLAKLRHEIEKWVEEHPRCSACGQAVTAELILSGGHAHE